MGAADLAGREQALAAAARHFDSGEFVRDLARRVAAGSGDRIVLKP